MSIRNAVLSDAEAIGHLLHQLDYPTSADFTAAKLPVLLTYPDQALLMYE